MPVAKSFQGLDIVCEPYFVEGRKYVKVRNDKGLVRQVRWYSDYEYAKMYGEELPPKKVLTKKEALGFADGYITIFKGDTYPLVDWFKSAGAKYKPLWGWYFAGGTAPGDIPAGIEAMRLNWENICNPFGDDLGPKEVIEMAVNALKYDASPSEYQGEVGDRIEETVVITKKLPFNGPYGPSTLYSMKDDNDNVYTWFTSSAADFQEGTQYRIRGTIKEHKMYRNERQTVLNRVQKVGY